MFKKNVLGVRVGFAFVWVYIHEDSFYEDFGIT